MDKKVQALPKKVLLGMGLGILVGILFGGYTKYLEPIGQIYTMLLEAAVYPYIVSALILSLASLSTPMSRHIFSKSWSIYLLFIGISFSVIYILSESIPSSASNIVLQPIATKFLYLDFIDKIIPKNFFSALANNKVPAIILFCCIFGLSLQNAKHVTPLLNILSAIKHGCLVFWNALIQISPYAVFSMIAYTIGNTDMVNLKSLFLYLFLMFFTCIFLGLVILPLLITCFIDINYKKILQIFKEAIVISLSTSLVVAAIPYIEQEIKTYLLDSSGKEDSEKTQIVSTVVSLSYPIGLVGNFCIFIFIIFAATYFQTPINQSSRIPLLVLSFFASIGSPSSAVSAVEFLSSWQRLPAAATGVFVEFMSITRYIQVLASTMGMAFLGFVICAIIFGKSKFRLSKLVIYLILTLAVSSACSFMIYKVFCGSVIQSKSLLDFDLDQKYKNINVSFKNNSSSPINGSYSTLENIRRNGVIRVGYNPTMIPFSYFNKKNVLVGYDVSYIYELADDLGVSIQFIPFEFDDLVSDIQHRKFDIAIGSIIVSPERLLEVSFTKPNFTDTIAFLIKSGEEKDFATIKSIDNKKSINVGVINSSFLVHTAQLNFPNNKIRIVQDGNPDINKVLSVGSLLWTYSHDAAIARIYSGYSAIIPSGMHGDGQVLMAFVVNKDDEQLLHYLNYWIDLKSSSGFQQIQYKRWILSEEPRHDARNWNIFQLFN